MRALYSKICTFCIGAGTTVKAITSKYTFHIASINENNSKCVLDLAI